MTDVEKVDRFSDLTETAVDKTAIYAKCSIG